MFPPQNCDSENRFCKRGQRYLYNCLAGNGPIVPVWVGFFPPATTIIDDMARGWESKSVEEQQSAAITQVESKQRLTPEQAARKQQEESIHLSRRHILQQLQSVQNPRHRQMLESALSELDTRLARMG